MDEKEHILIVDDDEGARNSLLLILGTKGYTVETAATGQEALEKARENFFNLALLDIKLPDIKGVELLTPLKTIHPDLTTIMVTAYASVETAIQALNEGASAYITKPLNMDEVMVTIQEALEKQRLIMENRRLYQALQIGQERYALATRAAKVGVWDWDIQSGDFYLDPNVKAILGYNDQEIPNDIEVWTTYMHPDDRQAVMDAAQAHLKGHTPEYVYEHRMLHKDGSVRWILVHGQAIRDAQGNAIRMVGTDADITAQVQAKKERAALIAQLEAQNDELGRFTYTVSHDLKSPLITIKGFLDLLIQDAAAGDTKHMQSHAARISDAATKMEQLLDELLELSRIGRVVNPPQEIDLGELVRETLDVMGGQLWEQSVQIEIAPHLQGPDGPTVYGDHPRLRQVLQNLIDNAIKYMGDQPEPRVEIGARRDGTETVVYVRDNGIGIHPRYHDRVFNLFDKLDPKSKGTGVGLAIVQRIIKVHSGRVWVESEGQGQGSTFCFTLAGE